MRSITHLESAIGAIRHGPLPAAIMAEIEHAIDRPPEEDPRER
jgi:hypothetical protein